MIMSSFIARTVACKTRGARNATWNVRAPNTSVYARLRRNCTRLGRRLPRRRTPRRRCSRPGAALVTFHLVQGLAKKLQPRWRQPRQGLHKGIERRRAALSLPHSRRTTMAAKQTEGGGNQGQQPKPGRQSVPEHNSEAQAEGRREIPPMSHVPQWSRSAKLDAHRHNLYYKADTSSKRRLRRQAEFFIRPVQRLRGSAQTLATQLNAWLDARTSSAMRRIKRQVLAERHEADTRHALNQVTRSFH